MATPHARGAANYGASRAVVIAPALAGRSRSTARSTRSRAPAPPRWSIRTAKASPTAWRRSRASARSASPLNNFDLFRCQPSPLSRKTFATVNKGARAKRTRQGRSDMALTPRRRPTIAAEAFLRALADHGVDYFFGNTGTDFPPHRRSLRPAPRRPTPRCRSRYPGAARKSRRSAWRMALSHHRQAAGGDGAHQCRAPPIPSTTSPTCRATACRCCWPPGAPRSPRRAFGSRNRPIQWGQEMFDQAGMLRELVKWDYELRMPARPAISWRAPRRSRHGASARPGLPDAAARTVAASLSEPIAPMKPRAQAAPVYPDPRAIATLAEWIAAPERPLDHHQRMPAAAVAAARRISPSAAPSPWSRTIRAPCACRRAIRCISASSRARCSPTPTS